MSLNECEIELSNLKRNQVDLNLDGFKKKAIIECHYLSEVSMHCVCFHLNFNIIHLIFSSNEEVVKHLRTVRMSINLKK